jgi:hypothetical protein
MAESDIQKGTRFITVPDTAFAAALVAMGVPFVDTATRAATWRPKVRRA